MTSHAVKTSSASHFHFVTSIVNTPEALCFNATFMQILLFSSPPQNSFENSRRPPQKRVSNKKCKKIEFRESVAVH